MLIDYTDFTQEQLNTFQYQVVVPFRDTIFLILVMNRGLLTLSNKPSGVPRGGAKGPCPPPKPESQGAKPSFAPPHSRYIRFFYLQIYIIHYYLLYT